MPTLLLLLAAAGCADNPKLSTDDTASDTGGTVTGGGTVTTGDTGGYAPIERRYDCQGMDPADAAPLGGYVALTFDDGPRVGTTDAIVAILRAYQVPATFFVLGERLEDPGTWDLVEELIADPLFDLANHSTTHADLTGPSPPEAAEEVDTTTELLASFGAEPAFFRFPYGLSDCELADAVRDRGYLLAGWHIDTGDWCYASGEVGVCEQRDYWRIPEEYSADMLGFSMEQIRRYDGGVVLFHDIHQYTADELEAFILAVQSEGYTFVALDDGEAFPNLKAGTPHDFPWQGEPCQVGEADECWQVEYLSWCEPVAPDEPGNTDGICTIDCEGYCLDRAGAATTFCATVPPGTGQCTSYAEAINESCALVPGTEPWDTERYVGSSGVPDASATVCAPPHWQ